MRTLLLAASLLLMPLAASAELTPAEKAEVAKVDLAARSIETAMDYLGTAMAETTPTNRAGLGTAMRSMLNAQGRMIQVAAWLLHAPISTDPVGWEARPISEWVTTAWAHLDATQAHLTAAQATLATVRAQGGGSAAYDDALRRARDIHLTGAQSRLAGFDRALSYADPLPIAAPQIIGPHGLYADAMSVGYLAQTFLYQAQDYGVTMYLAEWQTGWGNYFRLFGVRGGSVAKLIRGTWLNLALIPLNATECTRNRFHLVAQSLGKVTSHTSESGGQVGAPYHFNQLLIDVQASWQAEVVTRPAMRAAYVSLIQRWSDAWRYSDGMVWRALIFPDDTRLAEIRMQSAPTDDPFGPPLCP